MQRLVTDVDDESRRLKQTMSQNENALKQREDLEKAKEELDEELLTQQAQLDELAERMEKTISKHRTKVAEQMQVDVISLTNGTIEEKKARTEVLKDVVQNVLYTLGQLSSEFPEVTEYLLEKTKEADLKIPTKPLSRMGGSRQGAGASGLGVRSSGYGNENSRPSTGALSGRNFDLEL